MVALSQGEDYVNVDRRIGNKYFNRSIRYVDAIFNSMMDKPEKTSATSDTPKGVGAAKILGYREVPKQSYTERMFNTIGKANWRVGFFGDIPEADAKLNQRLFYYLEEAAETAFKVKGFKNMSMKRKEAFVRDLLQRAKRRTKDSIKNSLVVSDKALEKMYSLDKKYNDKVLRKAIKDLGYDKDLDDLTFEELELLDSFISDNAEYPKRVSKSLID